MDENRHRHTVWMDDNVWVQVESHYQRDNCTTKNEFIEKAVRFYSGYLDAESAAAYLLRALSDVLEGKLGALGKRMGRLLAVEQSLMENVLAADIDTGSGSAEKNPGPMRQRSKRNQLRRRASFPERGLSDAGTAPEVGLHQTLKRQRLLGIYGGAPPLPRTVFR